MPLSANLQAAVKAFRHGSLANASGVLMRSLIVGRQRESIRKQPTALYSAVAGAARAGGHVCAPSLWQKVIARCAHLRPDLESYDRNRKALYEGLTRMGYEMAKPDGAFYLFIKAPGGDANAFSDAAKKKDLLVVPGDGFGCPGYFRICYCVSLEMIQKSLPVFEELIKEFAEK